MMTADGLHPAVVYINTPFMVSRDVLGAAWRQRELTGRPLVWSHMPVMGMATPVTIDGALALATAEAIGANAFALAVDRQVCGWVRAGMCAVDVKSLNTTQWGPEVQLAHMGDEYIGRALFGDRPGRSAWSGVAAKRPGAQSMMERAFGFGVGFLTGARHFGGLSMLAFSDIGSTVQLMLDLELVDAMAHLAKGFSVDAETLAEDVIRQIAPRGATFMDTEHTARHFREALWIPELMDRRVASVALSDVSGMLDSARAKALRLMEEAPNRCPLDSGQRNDLLELLEEADRRHGS
jgi:trimethylamine:corrinoid methyltransferase-like protein